MIELLCLPAINAGATGLLLTFLNLFYVSHHCHRLTIALLASVSYPHQFHPLLTCFIGLPTRISQAQRLQDAPDSGRRRAQDILAAEGTMSMLGQVEGSRNSRIDGLADLDSPSPSKYYQNLLNSGTRDWEDAVTDDDGTGNCQIENLRIAAEIFQRHLSKPAYSALRRASDPGPNVSSSRRSSSQSKKRFKFPFRLKRRYSLPSILEIYYSVRSRYRKFKGRECNPEKQRLEELIEEAGEDLTFQSKYRDILEERLEELIEQIEEEYNAWESQCRSFLKALQDSISEDAPDYGVSAQLPGKGPSSGRGHIVHQFEEYKKFKRLVEAAQARETAGGFT